MCESRNLFPMRLEESEGNLGLPEVGWWCWCIILLMGVGGINR